MIPEQSMVLMHNYTLKKVSALKARDKLMGVAGEPNPIVSLQKCSEPVYKVKPAGRRPFYVGGSCPLHIRRLLANGTKETINIPAAMFHKRPNQWKETCRLICHPIEFMETAQPMQAYMAGTALYEEEFPEKKLKHFLNADGEFTIPLKYLYGAKHQRVALLSGIIDAGGKWDEANSAWLIRFSGRQICRDLTRLCGSLCLSATYRIVKTLSGDDMYELIVQTKKLDGNIDALYDLHLKDTQVKFSTEQLAEAAGRKIVLAGAEGQGHLFMTPDHILQMDASTE